MIAKVSHRVKGGSFERLAAYVTDDKRIGNVRDWQRTADYILDDKGDAARIGAVWTSNCHNPEPALALREIAGTQARNQTAKGDKTYHLIVSFQPGERPNQAQLQDIEKQLCAAIGLGDHQRLVAVHTDKDHFHMHLAVNKVHPATFKNVTPFYDHQKLAAACQQLEAKHGLVRENHEMPTGRGAGRSTLALSGWPRMVDSSP